MTKKTNIRLTSLAIALVLLMSLAIPFSASAEVRPATRTQSEIKAYLKAHPTDHNMPTEYKEQPSSIAPYKAGLVTDETQTYFMNAVNQVRFVAGLDEVTFDEHYQELAQAAALVNAANNEMTHYPKQPADMDDTLYALGAEGARSSNLGGRTSPAAEVFRGWLHDTDSHNTSRVGHRRWILNPFMGKTAFGQVDNQNAMYAIDFSHSSNVDTVMWPATNMPISMFYTGEAWSCSVGRDITDSEVNSLKVTLKNTKTGASYVFSKTSGTFYVNNDGYGLHGCIIFAPSETQIASYSAGDSYSVTISGLSTGTISYTVNFFDAGDNPYVKVSGVTLSPASVTLAPGEKVVLTATISPKNASNKQLTWWHRQDGVYSFKLLGENKNEITANSTGTSSVRVTTVDGAEATCKIIVKNPSIEIRKNTSDNNWYAYLGSKVDTSYNGIAKNKYGWWKCTNGRVTFKETGVFKNEYGWWRVVDSKVDFKANGIYKNQYGWWKTTDGKVTFKENGVFKNEYGWWKVKNSKVDFSFTGLASNKYGTWYIKNGKVDFKKNGKVIINGKTYTIVDGIVKK